MGALVDHLRGPCPVLGCILNECISRFVAERQGTAEQAVRVTLSIERVLKNTHICEGSIAVKGRNKLQKLELAPSQQRVPFLTRTHIRKVGNDSKRAKVRHGFEHVVNERTMLRVKVKYSTAGDSLSTTGIAGEGIHEALYLLLVRDMHFRVEISLSFARKCRVGATSRCETRRVEHGDDMIFQLHGEVDRAHCRRHLSTHRE